MAIATVADVVPLTGENRVIVKRGLEGLRQVTNPGLRALLDVSGFNAGDSPSAGQVAFQVAPRINAAGRMASATDVIELFLTTDAARARELAAKLHDLNKDRQQTEAEITRAIFEQCVAQPVTDPTPRWCSPAKAGIAAWWGSSPAAWWSDFTGPRSCWGSAKAWRKAPGAASPRFICWKRWSPCRTCSPNSEGTGRPPE